MCKGSKRIIFDLDGDWGSTFIVLGRLSLSLSLSLGLSFRLSLRGGLWLIPSGICVMQDPPRGMVNQLQLQMVVKCRSCRCTRTQS